ncbi:ribonuclease H-like domain-containing protein [Mycena maculata]|uniref:Ribonuclease H-like domain-containing protein n=1 Tax=Mycena maculata TaxID=230809 RepID=A0AAD7HQ83_9AGAR|nr:ribonuclease H-like domain-containing protein [Mycena maculata]
MSPPSGSLLFSPLPHSPSLSGYDYPPSPHLDSPNLKRRRTSTSSFSHAPPPWSADQQEEFGQDLCRLFVACGWSWKAVANPQFKLFFDKYLPAAKLPDRHVLSGRILDKEADKVIARTRQLIEGKLATYSEDSWTNIAKTHVDTSMLSVETKPYLLRTHDMTGRPKTGDELWGIVKSDLIYAKSMYNVEEEMPFLATFECWAHQSSLITGNFLSIKVSWMGAAKLAIEVIKWFNHHGTALDLLCTQQMMTFGESLALILPIITRWVLQYCSLRRLKKLERAIHACVITHEQTLRVCAGRKEEQVNAAERIIEIVKDDGFWKNIGRIASNLEPLAIASNLLQAPTCWLDTVLLCLGNLFRIFDSNQDEVVKTTVQGSLERRWGKTDQELMILAVFLNPYICSRAFNSAQLPPMAFYHLLCRAYKRFYGQDASTDIDFMQTFQLYCDNDGYFSPNSMWLEGYRAMYKEANQPIDIIAIWRRMDSGTGLAGCSGFVKLAIWILSMVPNSAGPERVFSIYGITHTKHRNCLDPLKVHKSTTVWMDCQESHRTAGLIPQRRPRRFSLADDQDEIAAMDANNSATPTPAPESSVVEMDFTVIADMLVDLATQEEAEDAAAELLPPVATCTPPPPPSASESVTNPVLRIPAYKKIKLADLFSYPAAGTPANELDFFWNGGISGLEEEEKELAAEAEGVSSPTDGFNETAA